MDDLIAETSLRLGLPEEKVRRGFGAVLSVIQTIGNAQAAAQLFAKVSGAEVLAKSAAAEGGLLGKMAGGMLGGPLALVSRLQGLGLSPDQAKAVTAAIIDHLKSRGDEKLLRMATSNISGLTGYL